jgi:hypothetical protein
MVSRIDAAFIAANNHEVIAFERFVLGYGRCVAAKIAAFDAINPRILKLSRSPNDVFGAQGFFRCIDPEIIANFRNRRTSVSG